MQAVRVEPSTAEPSDVTRAGARRPVPAASSCFPHLHGPAASDRRGSAPRAACRGRGDAMAGSVAVYKAPGPDGFTLNRLVDRGAVAGTLLTPLAAGLVGLWDRGAPVRVRIASGAAVVGGDGGGVERGQRRGHRPGDGAGWEVLQFGKAELVPRRNGRSPCACGGRPGAMPTCPPSGRRGAFSSARRGGHASGPSGLGTRSGAALARGTGAPRARRSELRGAGSRLRRDRPEAAAAGAPAGADRGGDLHLSWIRRGASMPTAGPVLDVPLGEATSSITCASSTPRAAAGGRTAHPIHLFRGERACGRDANTILHRSGPGLGPVRARTLCKDRHQ
jgi:hypothetical protein